MSEGSKTSADIGVLELANRVYEIGTLALLSSDFDDVVYRVMDSIMEIMDAQFVGIAMIDEAAAEVFHGWGTVRGEGPVFNDHRQGTDTGVVGRMFSTGAPVCVDDMREFPGYIDLIPGMRSELVVPLKVGDEIIGGLDVESGEVGKYGPTDTALLQALATPVAHALHSARLFQVERRRLEQLTMLNRVGHIVSSTTDVEEMLSRTVEIVRETLGCSFVGAGFVDEEAARVSLDALSSELEVDLPVGHSQWIGEGVVGQVVRTGRSLLVPDVSERDNIVPTHADLRCEMCCPLKVGDRVIGYLDAEEREPGAFDDDDLMLLETLADHIAQAVDNARNLERLAQLRTDLTGMMVHDLRNPLTVIRTTLDFVKEQLRDEGKIDDPRAMMAHKYVEQSDAACAEMFLLVDSLLELNKFEAGAQRLELREVTVADLIDGIHHRLRVVADSVGVSLVTFVSEPLPPLTVDVELFLRVLKNLVVNGIKFTPEGGRVTLDAEPAPTGPAERRLPGVERAVLFTVRDDGPGIPGDELDRIFEKFATVESRRSGRKYSTGLGLAFCKLAVHAHGGAIWADSVVGKGSVFRVLMPVSPAP